MGVDAGLWRGRRDGCCGVATVADDEARTDGVRGKGRPVAQGCRPNAVDVLEKARQQAWKSTKRKLND